VSVVGPALVAALFHAACRSPAPDAGAVETVIPEIVRSFAHDTAAFTQGLVFAGGYLYESTGLYRSSSLRCIDIDGGAVVKAVALGPHLFGEGLAAAGDRLVQLTWKENRALVYARDDFRVVDTIRYAGEGWGLTATPEFFIMSNGSDTLYFRGRDFRVRKKLAVRHNGKPLASLNELEYARGMVYANVWYSNYIFEIDPSSGAVTRSVDCTALAQQAGEIDSEKVLNGIAWDEERDRFYCTGKKWPLVFEVTIPPPALR
jgi:glutamine cyclotransferase